MDSLKTLFFFAIIFTSCATSVKHESPKPKRQLAGEKSKLYSNNCELLLNDVLTAQGKFIEGEREVVATLMAKMQKVMGNPEKLKLSEAMIFRLEYYFVRRLRDKIQNLDAYEVALLERNLSNSEVDLDSRLSLFGEARMLDEMKDNYILINEYVFSHPYARVVMWHELDHLIQYILNKKKTGKALEISAFKEEYQFMRDAFTIADLKEIKRNFKPLNNTFYTRELINEGLIFENKGKFYVNFDLLYKIIENPQLGERFLNFVNDYISIEFIGNIESALTLTEREFVKLKLKSYHYGQ